ncbi:DUF3558 domain-containing protein [Gordonia rubripertincta]|uniref:DUF3558 domain-containing protein n=3 Tax=Gordonia rubripertincta TaxID=36822 RepID=A0ABQ0HP40_GORRU|nr:DUF3558 domain-containing protein [Gordonia rubripertincta]NKY61461.1 DUF3558 domain-containing protein [Gordonia rubripertincta]NKY61638.1 DUF3558 domain-containing protein [Gordonia rubripertincta]GAB84039.1 hypothetical protein GORBP_028_00430 [Gordonia rubripertincta NBRC 101908]
MRNPRLAGLSVALASFTMLALSGCATESGQPVAEPSTAMSPSKAQEIRQTDDAGNRLPFETEFPNRWSINNDGSTYEPCTQVSVDVVTRFVLDPDSVGDVAASDFQTARGCEWKYVDDRRSSIAQFVGNLQRPEAGLSGHKASNDAGTTWLPDTEVNGRRVLRESMGPGDCTVYVRSGNALVITSVTRMGFNPPPTEQLCAEATDFLTATIAQIPN